MLPSAHHHHHHHSSFITHHSSLIIHHHHRHDSHLASSFRGGDKRVVVPYRTVQYSTVLLLWLWLV